MKKPEGWRAPVPCPGCGGRVTDAHFNIGVSRPNPKYPEGPCTVEEQMRILCENGCQVAFDKTTHYAHRSHLRDFSEMPIIRKFRKSYGAETIKFE